MPREVIIDGVVYAPIHANPPPPRASFWRAWSHEDGRWLSCWYDSEDKGRRDIRTTERPSTYTLCRFDSAPL